MSNRRLFYSFLLILLLIVAVAGWFATDYLGNKARQEIIGESHASVLSLSIYVSSTFTNIEGAVKSLAGSPWIAPVLLSKGAQDIEHANSAMDRYNSNMNASVTYLMDANGMTVASSNRKDPDSFVGKSYRFRPYFQEAAKGQPGRYFALGITSGKRGFYASCPVRNRLGHVVGVVTMKKDLDEMEAFFSRQPLCFLISRNGIIFLSSSREMLQKSFWPLDKAVRETLIASQQFGNNLSEAVFKNEIADGTEVALKGKDYFVSRSVIDGDGWSIVLLTPTDRIRSYKLIGILATISVCLLILIFLGIIYIKDRSNEVVRQSEESRRLLLNAAGEGIFGVDVKGQLTFINPKALRMLGFSEEEIIGQSVHSLIHHSHKDGSHYPVEDCPMYFSYTVATENRITDQILWRKDGSSFLAEYSSMPIIKDGKLMGAVVTFRDITARKRAEEALRESEKKYRFVVDNMADVITVMDMNLRITYISPSIMRLRGYTVEEAMTRTMEQMMTPESLQIVAKVFEEELKLETSGTADLGRSRVLELEEYRKDGSVVWLENSLSYIRDEAQKPVGIISLSRDITARKQAEEALQESEELFRSYLENAPDGVYMSDLEGNFLYGNRRCEEIIGYRREELTGKNFLELNILSEKSLHIAVQLLQANMEGKPTGPDEIQLISKEGREIPLEINTSVVQRRGQAIVLAFVRDITARKQAEEALQESEEKYRSIFDNAPLGLLHFDKEGIITSCNDKLVGIIGSSPEVMIGLNMLDLPDQHIVEAVKMALNGKLGYYDDEYHSTTATKITPVHALFTPITSGQGEVVGGVGIIEDVTERKRIEQALRESENRYRELSIVDDLTQLYNSRQFYLQLKTELDRSNRYELPLTLLLLDLDNFKAFNDAYGHIEGDHVLRQLGKVIKRCLRQTDSAYRYGGEEFTILLPMTTGKDAAVTAERIRAELRKEIFHLAPGKDVHMTVSIGLGQYRPQEDAKAFVSRVDQLMYRAKKNGKDRVCSES